MSWLRLALLLPLIAGALGAFPGAATAQTYRICFCAPETHTGGCSPFTSGYTATLQPLGLRRSVLYVDSQMPNGGSCFDGIPAGSYLLEVSRSCNPFGCLTRTVPVDVVDTDAFAFIRRINCPCGYYSGFWCTVLSPSTLSRCVEQALDLHSGECPICDVDGDDETTVDDLVANVVRLDEECPAACR